MVGIKIITEADSYCFQFVFQLVEDVNHIRNFVLVVFGMQFDNQVLVIDAAFTCSLNQFDEIVDWKGSLESKGYAKQWGWRVSLWLHVLDRMHLFLVRSVCIIRFFVFRLIR